MELSKAEQYIQTGSDRAKIENKMLMLMFNGFSTIYLQPANNDTNELCLSLGQLIDFSDYLMPENVYNEVDFTVMSDEAKSVYFVIEVLDSLVARRLASRKIFFTSDFDPSGGPQIMNQEQLNKTQACSNRFLANAVTSCDVHKMHVTFEEEGGDLKYYFEYIEYQLETKGYDVALSMQHHADSERATKAAREVAQSSVKTAKTAVVVAVFIAVGSIGNLVFQLLEKYKVLEIIAAL